MGGETVGNRHLPPLPPPNTHPGATFFRLCAEAFLRQSFQNADSWALPSDSNEGPGNHSFKNTEIRMLAIISSKRYHGETKD